MTHFFSEPLPSRGGGEGGGASQMVPVYLCLHLATECNEVLRRDLGLGKEQVTRFWL